MSMSNANVAITNVPLPIDGNNPNAVKVDGSAVTQPVSGTIAVSNFPASSSSSVSTATITQNAVSAAAITPLLAERDERIKVVIFSEGGPCYIAASAVASTNQYTWLLEAGDELEITNYTGPLSARGFAPGTFNVQVTDF